MRLAVPTSRPLSRLTETRLLFWVAAITVTGFFTVALALGQGLDGNAFIVPTAFLVIAFVVHAALAMRGLRGDQIMLPVSLGLTGIGLIVIYRVTAGTDADRAQAQRQAKSDPL